MTVRCKCFTQAIHVMIMMISSHVCTMQVTVWLPIGGGVRVYPGVLHLLCRWYEPPHLTDMLIYNIIDDLVIIFYVYTGHGRRNFMLQSMIMVTKQRSISMFGCLWLRGTPLCSKKTWRHFKHSGKRRSQGSFPTSKITMLTELVSKPKVTIHYNVNHYKVTFIYLEKWALAYRHFEHRDTDMNMLMER